jgi:hypothetical protein
MLGSMFMGVVSSIVRIGLGPEKGILGPAGIHQPVSGYLIIMTSGYILQFLIDKQVRKINSQKLRL